MLAAPYNINGAPALGITYGTKLRATQYSTLLRDTIQSCLYEEPMNRPTSRRLKQIITNAIATCIVNGATPEGWHNLNVPEPRTQYVLLPPFSPAVVFFFLALHVCKICDIFLGTSSLLLRFKSCDGYVEADVALDRSQRDRAPSRRKQCTRRNGPLPTAVRCTNTVRVEPDNTRPRCSEHWNLIKFPHG